MRDTPRYGTGPTNDILWYDKPAGLYTEGLPIGTGRLAAMVFGGVRRERVALNHEWLWRGRHRQSRRHGRRSGNAAAELPRRAAFPAGLAVLLADRAGERIARAAASP